MTTNKRRRITASYYEMAKENPSIKRVIWSIVGRWANNATEMEDFNDIADHELLRCMRGYDQSRNVSFTTFLFGRVRNSIRHAIDVEKRAKRVILTGNPGLFAIGDGHGPDVSLLVQECLECLTDEERDVITELFFNHETLRSLAVKKKVCHATIGFKRKRALKKMRAMCGVDGGKGNG